MVVGGRQVVDSSLDGKTLQPLIIDTHHPPFSTVLKHVQANTVIISLKSKCCSHVDFSWLVVQVPNSESFNIIYLLYYVRVNATFPSCCIHLIANDDPECEFKHVGFDRL